MEFEGADPVAVGVVEVAVTADVGVVGCAGVEAGESYGGDGGVDDGEAVAWGGGFAVGDFPGAAFVRVPHQGGVVAAASGKAQVADTMAVGGVPVSEEDGEEDGRKGVVCFMVWHFPVWRYQAD